MRRWIEGARSRLLLAAAAPVAAALLWAAWPADGSAPAPPLAPAAPAATAPAPLPSGTVAAPAPPSADGLVLHGLAGGGAIIGTAGGAQRFVRIGRDVVPGLILAEIRQHQAVLRGPGGDILLDFAGAAEAPASAVAAPQPGPASGTAERREETLRYRLGLEPREVNGRIDGFVIRSGAEVPQLHKAGLRAGDVLVSVNGQALRSEERIEDLAEEIGTAVTAEFAFERNGRRMRSKMAVSRQ